MADFERSATIHAPADATYEYLADPRNIPDYVARMTLAQEARGGHLHVAAEVEGRHEEGEAMFLADPAARRLEWGREGHEYHGWLAVAGMTGAETSQVTIHIETHDDADAGEVERALDETMDNIERAMSAAEVGA
jgi:Polyketide cyclase / dehydrase and lipid transport